MRTPRLRLGHRGRWPALAATAACLLALAGPPTATAARGAIHHLPAIQPLASLLVGHRVRRAPRLGATVFAYVGAHRPITNDQTALPVIGRSTGRDGIHWLKVMLPGRPNGSTGWITQQDTRASVTGWRLRVELGRRRVSVYRHGELVMSFRAVVGKPSTPTPTGAFFVEETLQMRPGEPGGPFALALSARSDALREFEGGPGQIAIHGRDSLGGILGNAESHGCVRMATSSIAWLAARIGPGVPVSVLGG